MLTDDQIQKLSQKYDEGDIDALLWKAIEEDAAEKEITVDYYIAEFL